MHRHWQGLVVVALAAAGLSVASCTTAGQRAPAGESAMVLECAAADIHHVFRITPATHAVEDLAFTPAKAGVADVTSAEYRLLFQERRDHYELMVQVDRASGKGTRRLFDDEQQPIKGHGGTDDIVCTERVSSN